MKATAARLIMSTWLLVAYVQTEQTEEMNQMAQMLRKSCLKETGVNEDTVVATGKGIFADDEKLKCYLKCLYVNMGMFSQEDSRLDTEALMALAPENMKSYYEDSISKCTPLSGSNDCEKLFNFNQCVYNLAPEKYMVV